MDIAFWKERWETGQIGFHEGRPNELLVRHVHLLNRRKRVLVPLAGKAQDMVLLASREHEVVGVEIVEDACRQFFDENKLPLVVEEKFPFTIYGGGGVQMWCGDVFDATPERMGLFDGVYDRAALVALDPATRARYVDTLTKLLIPGGRILLVAFSYDQRKLDGPPWSIDFRTVKALFQRDFVIEVLEEREAAMGPRFVQAGVTDVKETIYLLTRM
jgi:thiopurine S-methyltransferase